MKVQYISEHINYTNLTINKVYAASDYPLKVFNTEFILITNDKNEDVYYNKSCFKVIDL